MKNGIPGFIA